LAFGNFTSSKISLNEISDNFLVDIKKRDVEEAVNNLYKKIERPLKEQIVKSYSIPQGKSNEVSQELTSLIEQVFSGKDNFIKEIEQRQNYNLDNDSIKNIVSNHIKLMFENTQTALMLGKIEALNLFGCKKYEYNCSEEDNVCANCRALKDKMLESEDANIGVNFPPIHPYCRCDIVGINNDGETVKFADGNIFTPEFL